MKLYLTLSGAVLEAEGIFTTVEEDWDDLIRRDDLRSHLAAFLRKSPSKLKIEQVEELGLCPPVRSQEVWAAGVTYVRSREARKEESQEVGGGDFYDRVYSADRPELFLKGPPGRVRGHSQPIRIRRDASWNVPEPELTLAVSSGGRIVGYTIGNDMSSRDIEGENPLYLPQAKIYDGSCAVGPGILVTESSLSPETAIRLTVLRGGEVVWRDQTQLKKMKRTPQELVNYLYQETSFPHGCLIMTGTGVIPPSNFTLQLGDQVRIGIDPIGTLENTVCP